MSDLTLSNAIGLLESAADSGCWQAFGLPSGKKIIVAPDNGFETLQVALRDPDFITLLKESVKDVADGNVIAVDDDF